VKNGPKKDCDICDIFCDIFSVTKSVTFCDSEERVNLCGDYIYRAFAVDLSKAGL
jgi:hypothetical protein